MESTKSIEHIDYPLVAHTHTPMYLMHKYWARKPHNVVATYIERYSQPGDIILDPFSGSGVTPCETLKLGRKAIAVDIDPLGIFMTRCTATPIDIDKFSETFENLKTKLKPAIDDLYKTNCLNCNKETIAEAAIWRNNTPKEIRYSCSCKRGRMWKNPAEIDKRVLEQIEKIKIPYWYPQNELIWNTRVNVHRGTKVYELFTKRNLLALSMILNEIESGITNKQLKDIFKFTFSSALPQASKLVFVYRIKGRERQVGGWATRGYWVPPEFFEINAWNCFETRFRKVRRGKKESNKLINEFKETLKFEGLQNEANLLLLNQSTLDLSNIPTDSVDYIFTDPPYGDSVPYLELDYMWNSWLRFNVDFKEEIIISDSPTRNKTFDLYEKMLNAAFREVFRVLKPGKWLTVTFHNKDITVWNAIINAVVLGGFDLEKIIFQPPARVSPKGLLALYGSAVGDYYIRFRKPEAPKTKSANILFEARYERIIVAAAKKIIAERGEPSPYQYLLNGIIPELDKNGVLLKGTKDIQNVLKEHLNEDFVLIDVIGQEGKKKGEKWWLKDPESIKINLVPLYERVEKAVINVLNREIRVSFDDILQEIFIAFPNALTPDTQSIKSVVQEYATKAGRKFWQLKPRVAQRERQHSQMIFFLAELGKKMAYKIWIGSREQGDKYKGRRLSELSEKQLKLVCSPAKETLSRIKDIDVLWLSDGEIKAAFEVENTTTITEAIVRGSNIPYSVHRFIIIPEERENLISRKINEPGLQELGIKTWDFVFYRNLVDFYTEHKRQKTVLFQDFLNIAREPRYRTEKQASLGLFEEED